MLKLLLSHHIFISLCSASFFASGSRLIKNDFPSLTLVSTVFWSTLLIYQVNSRTSFNFLDASSYKNINFKHDGALLFYLSLALILIIHLPLLDLTTIIYLLHLAILSTLYNVPANSKSFIKIPLRSIPFLKIFLIAYVWASMLAFLPIISNPIDQNLSNVVSLFGAHFLFIISITLPFDIRDFETDHKSQVMTIPHLIGIKMTKGLALLFLIIFYILMLPQLGPIYLTLFCLITAGLILYASSKRKTYYFTLFIDGTIILYYFVIQLST